MDKEISSIYYHNYLIVDVDNGGEEDLCACPILVSAHGTRNHPNIELVVSIFFTTFMSYIIFQLLFS